MVELHFQDGFFAEPVEVSCDGRTIFAQTLTSDPRIGLAHIESPDCPPDAALTVVLPNRDWSQHIERRPPYVAITIRDGVVEVEYRDRSPGYL